MRRTVVLLAMTTVLLAACRKKPPEVAPTPTTPTPSAQPTMNLDSLRRAQAMADSLRRAEDASRMGRDASERARAALVQTVYFEYDEAGIRDDARQALDAKVPVLRSNPGVRMTIEGHADERGSVEYNLALGMRRATSVRDYLTGFGLEANRFGTVSFGEERPVDPRQDDDAYARNRRAEFRLTSGGDNLRP
jgi:peptidoglycan-associated lipoprotein